ncbi:MAG: CBS domain-containing protein [Deltaproteobacteria bacterium]|nr:CBS domain-containing protein [Deltaproteobacteria bacterium]
MSSPAITVTTETPLSEVAHIFVQQGVSRVPVVDGESRLIGLVSRSELVKAALRKASVKGKEAR